MSDTVSLITASEAVKRVAMTPGKGRNPSVAVVYATRDGDLEVLDGGKPMRWSDQMFTKYRMRYEVDISDHHLTVEFKDNLALPTEADVYHFHATVSASFRVTDPAEVVRRNVTDAAALVRGHLLGVCRPITRQYSIEEAEEAEAAIHARFRRETLIQGGLTLYAVEARLSLDEAGRKYLQDVEQAARDDRVKAAQHTTNVNDVAREGQIDVLKQAGRHLIEERERLVLESQSMDPVAMVRLHLQRNPGDTAGALEMVTKLEAARLENRKDETDRWQNFLSTMASENMLQPADVAPLLNAAVRRMEDSAGVIQATATVGPPPAQAPAPAAAPQKELDWDAPLAGSGPANLSPVYVIIDESAATAGSIEDLNTAVEDLYTTLGNQPRAASAVRIAVLGYAEDVVARVPMGAVGPGATFPKLTTRGPADHARLFQWLDDFVPGDLESLRATHASVRPPLLVLFTGSAPGAGWEAAHRRLTRRVRHADLIAFGVGAGAGSVADFATYPELAFVAEGMDSETAIGHFAGFLQRHVVDRGQAAADGTEIPAPTPTGFRIGADPA
jgi:uncharacterized protein YegL